MRLLLAALLLLPAACTKQTAGDEPESYTYVCPNGVSFSIRFDQDADTAILTLDGRRMILQHAISGSGARYINGDTQYWAKGMVNAMFRHKGSDYGICKVPQEEKPCPERYDPLCGQPPMPECPPGLSCPAVMPPPKTYRNLCLMEKGKATLLYQGKCR